MRASRWLERPELERRLDGALTHRLTTVTAAAGYGKSALLDRWGAAVGAARHRLAADDRELAALVRHVVGALRQRSPDLAVELGVALDGPLGPSGASDAASRAAGLAGALGEALHGALRRDLVLILDDHDHLAAGSPSAQFLDTLLRSGPNRFHLVVAGRSAPPFAVDRLRARRQVLELTAAELALGDAEVRRWVAAVCDDQTIADRATERILERTGGWPAGVRELVRQLTEATSSEAREACLAAAAPLPIYHDLVVSAFDALTPEERELMLLASVLPALPSELASALGLSAARLADVHRVGSLLHVDPDDRASSFRATPAARTALAGLAASDIDTAGRVAAAARWFVDTGRPDLALRTLTDHDDVGALTELLQRHGDHLATGGSAAAVLAALDGHPGGTGGSSDEVWISRLRGLAHHALGDWDRAIELLQVATESPDDTDALVAWRLGLMHHMRGELDAALAVYQRGRYGDPPADAVICTAMYATVRWLRGERDLCADAADEALLRAQELGEDRPLAAAHTVLAMLAALDGDRRANDAHYTRALEHAERAGDAFQLIRIRVNRASRHLEEGAYADALDELEVAGHLAELTGFSPFTAVALSNRAEALVHLGRLEEAAADAADAVTTWRELGSRLVVYGLEQLAAVQHLRGDRAGAATSYEAAVAAAEDASDVQGLVAALAGLSELRCDEDPTAALEVARRAVAQGRGLGYVRACLATARAAAATDERQLAREHLELARQEARTRQDAPGLAAATELQGQLDRDDACAAEAIAAWREVGDPIAIAGAELTRAEILAAGGEHRDVLGDVISSVGERMRAIGCRVHDDRLARLQATSAGEHGTDGTAISVQTLGGFRVTRDGTPLSRGDWQSRKARLLVKLLASQRGEVTSREWLSEHLWPGADADLADRRLRVLVSTVRSLLDPGRRHPSDHVLVSDHQMLRLDLRHVDLDVTRFLAAVEAAARLESQGHTRDALTRWRTAEAAYTGAFCPEEPYADWSIRTREELRTAYVQACARVAAAEAEAGNHDEAVRRWLRLLETDPYDERAHLALVDVLVRAGRRSEARRRYVTYVERMHELDLETVPFPAS